MKLIEALDLDDERIIALAGAGGKTSSLFLLGRELARQGRKAVLTTTARMYQPEPGQIPVILEGRPEHIGERVANLLTEHDQVLVGAGVEKGKLMGLSCQTLLALAELPVVDAVVVEADGSRGLPLKFADDYEPVICSAEALVVPVLGISALGAKLDECSFQRWELAREFLGVEYGAEITPELAAAVLCHPRSYGRFLGKNRVVPLINQVDTREQEDLAWETARLLLTRPGIDRVVIGAVQTDQPVRAVIHRDGGKEDD